MNLVSEILSEELNIISFFFKKKRRLQKKFFLKKISTLKKDNLIVGNNNFLTLYQVFFLILSFFFFKNFLIFNAEKLMLVYFLVISSLIFFFTRAILIDLINKDIKKFIQFIIEIEEESNNSIKILISYLFKLKNNFTLNTVEHLLIKNLELRSAKRIK